MKKIELRERCLAAQADCKLIIRNTDNPEALIYANKALLALERCKARLPKVDVEDRHKDDENSRTHKA